MSYAANQYNYATPLSSAADVIGESYNSTNAKLFTLHDNLLDGTYFPIVGDVGLWGNSFADSEGNLPEPFVVTVDGERFVNAYRLSGDATSYPVAFTVDFYNGPTLLYNITETSNSNVEYVHYMSETLSVTKYVLTVTKISAPNHVARVYNS